MQYSTLLSTLLFPLALAAPTQQKRADLTFTVTDFASTIASSTSSLSFTFADTRPKYTLSTTCTLSAPTPDGIYLDIPTPCANSEVGFKYTPGGGDLIVQRKWSSGEMYMTSFAQQGTWWTEGVNVTDTVDGKVYARSEPWLFKETSRAG
ncbi:hypothetical protein BDV96DRAFT_651111 [Lophiotrema nucula]|uniref:AA1-like domain-containing protein n=1 Tax=Lophiotrema nucula TaxID=690887 RepID=A0A6A5YTK6_9PLEO|nr:hypothetical protein BDV96DRAFT_651111 [Lophiotrema nucula]